MKVKLWILLSPLRRREVRWYDEMVIGQGLEGEPLVLKFVGSSQRAHWCWCSRPTVSPTKSSSLNQCYYQTSYNAVDDYSITHAVKMISTLALSPCSDPLSERDTFTFTSRDWVSHHPHPLTLVRALRNECRLFLLRRPLASPFQRPSRRNNKHSSFLANLSH